MVQKKLKKMEKLIGHKVNCAVFISGNGTNLCSILKSSRKKDFPIKVKLVISNKASANGLKYARLNNIPYKIFSSLNMKIFEKKTIKELKKNKIEFICLAGFLKILSKKFINNFKYRIINIHPSLLPKYKGLNTHFRVIKNKDKISGCTVHYVSSKLDSGKIILQKKVKVKNSDTSLSLQKRILKQEHKLYPRAIKTIFS